MKQKSFLAVILLLVCSIALGQDFNTHIVQRGETLEFIAQYYGITTEELKASNPDMDMSYTGLVLRIPSAKPMENKKMDTHPLSLFVPSEARMQAYVKDCKVADSFFEAREYRKAQKKYKEIICEYGKDLPCIAALYYNALCSYNREKWKTAIEDLSVVVNNDACPNKLRNHCRKLLEKAQANRNQQLENRTNFWGGLLVTAAAVGTSVALSSAQSESYTSVNGNSDTSSNISSPSSSSADVSVSSSVSSSSCPSLNVARGKYYCANTGRCGMCGGDGLMDAGFGNGVNNIKCTLCGGTGKCKYCK